MKMGMKRLVYVLLHLIHWISCSQDVCARLKFVNGTRDVLQVFDNDFINITFYLDTGNCSGNHSYIVTVTSLMKNDSRKDICKVILKNDTYRISQNSHQCRLCSSKDKIKLSGRAELQLTKLIFLVIADNVKPVDTVNITVNVFARKSSIPKDMTATTTTVGNTKQHQTSTWSIGASLHANDWTNFLIGLVAILVIALLVVSMFWLTSLRRRGNADLMADEYELIM